MNINLHRNLLGVNVEGSRTNGENSGSPVCIGKATKTLQDLLERKGHMNIKSIRLKGLIIMIIWL